MNANEALTMIRKHKGPICVCFMSKDNIYWPKIVKSDLLDILSGIGDNQITVEVKNGVMFVDHA